MYREAAESAAAVRRQLRANAESMRQLGAVLRRVAPRAVVTIARGSSDHAATYARYLLETRCGVLTASAAPSVSSVYAARPDLRGALCLAISQSGRSPDLLAAADAARASGGLVVALVNAEDAPLAARADHVVWLRAGAETSVAATKSHIASLAAILHLVAEWSTDASLSEALAALPDGLDAAWRLDWSAAIERLKESRNLFVLGRGLGLGVAQEAALKLKETSGLHAEGISAAELQHGPMALVQTRIPGLHVRAGRRDQRQQRGAGRPAGGAGCSAHRRRTPGAWVRSSCRRSARIRPRRRRS